MKNLKNSLIAIVLVAMSFVSYAQTDTLYFNLMTGSDTIVEFNEYTGGYDQLNYQISIKETFSINNDSVSFTAGINTISKEINNIQIFEHGVIKPDEMRISDNTFWTLIDGEYIQIKDSMINESNKNPNNTSNTNKFKLQYGTYYSIRITITGTYGNGTPNFIFISLYISDPALSVSEEVLEVTNTRVYPNPVINNLTVEFETTNSSTELEVYSINGQLMFKDNEYRGFGKNTVSVDMSNYPKGMYIVRLGNEVKKVIKQ